MDFVLELKKCDSNSSRKAKLDQIIDKLHQHSSGATQSHSLQMVKVPAVVASTWRNLLLSPTCSDVTIVCGGGEELPEELPAHTCVLASASEYFSNLFTDRWREQVDDGRLLTRHPADLMRGVLSFIYTGDVPLELVEGQADGLFALANMYFLKELASVAEAKLVRHKDQTRGALPDCC